MKEEINPGDMPVKKYGSLDDFIKKLEKGMGKLKLYTYQEILPNVKYVDEYITDFAKSLGNNYKYFNAGVVYSYDGRCFIARGLRKAKALHGIVDNGYPFFYIDTGYFGNNITKKNPAGRKDWHRVAYMNYQCTDILDKSFSDKRFRAIGEPLSPWKKGKKEKKGAILLCPPSRKSLHAFRFGNVKLFNEWKQKPGFGKGGKSSLGDAFYDKWLKDTIKEIKKYSNRKIIVRTKPAKRSARTSGDTSFKHAVNQNVWATVTYNSIVAVESIMNGVPAFVMAPNAAGPVAIHDLSKLEDTKTYGHYDNEPDRKTWINHLSHHQFRTSEIADGTCYNTLKKLYKINGK